MPLNYLQKTINTVTDDVIIPGNLEVGGTLEVTGATTLSSTLAVTGAATFASTAAFTGLVTMASTLSVAGAAAFLTVTTGAITSTATITATGIITGSRVQESAGTTTVTANTAYAVLSTDRYVLISTTGAGGPFAITFPSITFITKVTIRMTAFNTSSYTATCNQGTVTWGAANHVATFISNISSTTWSLIGAAQPTTMTA